MSIKALNWAFDLYFKIPSHKLVMLALADNATNEGLSYPFLKTIAMKSCLKIRQVQYILRRLEEDGYISTEEHFKKGNKQTSNCYQLNIEKQFETIKDLSTGVQSSAGEGCSPVQGRGAVQTTHTIIKTTRKTLKNKIIQEPENHQPKLITNNNNLKQKQDVVLPEWLDKDSWNEFKEYRKEINKPMNVIAEKKALTVLETLKSSGQNPLEIITQSIVHGWAGLFPIKKFNQNIQQEVQRPKMIDYTEIRLREEEEQRQLKH